LGIDQTQDRHRERMLAELRGEATIEIVKVKSAGARDSGPKVASLCPVTSVRLP
jgi:hypothetical protein